MIGERKRYMSRVTYRTDAVGLLTVDYAHDTNAELDVFIEAAVMNMGQGFKALVLIEVLPGVVYTDTIESLTATLNVLAKPCNTDEPF